MMLSNIARRCYYLGFSNNNNNNINRMTIRNLYKISYHHHHHHNNNNNNNNKKANHQGRTILSLPMRSVSSILSSCSYYTTAMSTSSSTANSIHSNTHKKGRNNHQHQHQHQQHYDYHYHYYTTTFCKRSFASQPLGNVMGGGQQQQQQQQSFLEQFSVDLTAEAQHNNLDPIIGRHDEIRRCLQILARRTKNNPILIGEAGVGKTGTYVDRRDIYIYIYKGF